jgi:hypothetical protein
VVVDNGTVVVEGGKLDVVVVSSPALLEQAVSKTMTTMRRFIYRMALRNPSREPR